MSKEEVIFILQILYYLLSHFEQILENSQRCLKGKCGGFHHCPRLWTKQYIGGGEGKIETTKKGTRG